MGFWWWAGVEGGHYGGGLQPVLHKETKLLYWTFILKVEWLQD
jgi:hypothetical protein